MLAGVSVVGGLLAGGAGLWLAQRLVLRVGAAPADGKAAAHEGSPLLFSASGADGKAAAREGSPLLFSASGPGVNSEPAQ